MSRDGQADKAPVPNHALAARMKEKGFSEARLATAAGVDTKTVGRWVRSESLPQAVNARAAADALGCDPQALWPDLFPIMRPPGTGTVAVSVYGSRADIPVTVWTEPFGGAAEAIDILVYGGTFLFDGVARFPKLLTAATDRGVAVRFIIGDPDSAAVAQRGAEEQIGSSLAGRCRMTLARLQPSLAPPDWRFVLTPRRCTPRCFAPTTRSSPTRTSTVPRPATIPPSSSDATTHPSCGTTTKPPSSGSGTPPAPSELPHNAPVDALKDQMARTDYYNDPDAPPANSVVPSTTAVVTDDQDRIVLIRRRDNDLWALPGGGMELGESIVDTAVREVKRKPDSTSKSPA